MKLDTGFYRKPTLDIARDLLGKVLVRSTDRGSDLLAGQIVETEAYIGQDDRACHASRGRTPRTEVMFGPPGHAYVYMIYGMYCCLNVVTESSGFPAAVLIRAIEPLEGGDEMKRNRGRDLPPHQIGSGPGKLCQAMRIDRNLNTESLTGSRLWIEDRGYEVGEVLSSPRIGVAYAGTWSARPWRYFRADNPHVSRHPLNASGTFLSQR